MSGASGERIRVVVVDDEPYLLRSVKQSIETAHADFSVVGEALDGEQAIQVIERLRPDIVFTDIRMPIVDGLGLIEELRRRNCEAQPVILSGYQDFDYAKRAMRLEVADYLLKPIDPLALEKLLGELHEKIEGRRKARRQAALESILRNKAAREAVCPAGREEEGDLFSRYEGYACLYVCSGPYCAYSSAWTAALAEPSFAVDLEAILARCLDKGEDCWVMDVDRANERIVVIGTASGLASRSYELASRIHHALDLPGFSVTTVASHLHGKPDELSSLAPRMRSCLLHRSVFGESRLLRLEDPPRRSEGEEGNRAPFQEKPFSVLVLNRRRDQLKQEIGRILKACEAGHCTQYALERQLRRICVLLFGLREDPSTPEERIESILGESRGYAEVYDGLCFLVDDLFDRFDRDRAPTEDLDSSMKKVDQYLVSNFSTLSSLETVARLFRMTPSYLSGAYKKSMGVSPLKRITQLRIEKAKELLAMSPRIAIKEISDAIGYDDPYYFSRIFKTVVGRSPSQFRECGEPPAPRPPEPGDAAPADDSG
jgi:two-component system, response regulator YesN